MGSSKRLWMMANKATRGETERVVQDAITGRMGRRERV